MTNTPDTSAKSREKHAHSLAHLLLSSSLAPAPEAPQSSRERGYLHHSALCPLTLSQSADPRAPLPRKDWRGAQDPGVQNPGQFAGWAHGLPQLEGLLTPGMRRGTWAYSHCTPDPGPGRCWKALALCLSVWETLQTDPWQARDCRKRQDKSRETGKLHLVRKPTLLAAHARLRRHLLAEGALHVYQHLGTPVLGASRHPAHRPPQPAQAGSCCCPGVVETVVLCLL